MLGDKARIMACHERKMGNKTIPIFQLAVKKDPELIIEAWVQDTVAVYVIHLAIVQFDTHLGNI